MPKNDAGRNENPAFAGDATPMRPENVTLGPLEQENGETADQVAVRDDAPTVADGELPIAERRRQGIEDNVRHVDSIGRR